jgi:hypothetical protein
VEIGEIRFGGSGNMSSCGELLIYAKAPGACSADSAPAFCQNCCQTGHRLVGIDIGKNASVFRTWCPHEDSNPGPTD